VSIYFTVVRVKITAVLLVDRRAICFIQFVEPTTTQSRVWRLAVVFL
jgi:hypothetical protein